MCKTLQTLAAIAFYTFCATCSGLTRAPYISTEPTIPVSYADHPAVERFIGSMVNRHAFSWDELRQLFAQVHYSETVIRIMTSQTALASGIAPKRDWSAYRSRFIEPKRIEAGLEFWRSHATSLARAQQEYGIPPEIIIGILGVETLYGRNQGSLRVLDTLATLAFDYPLQARVNRSEWFLKQLEVFLLLARDQHFDPFSVLGSYAGAIGMPQFMPESYRNFAVDFDNNGRIDLNNSPQDAIGSIARFLASHGWKRDQPIVFTAYVLGDLSKVQYGGLHTNYVVQELASLGIFSPAAPAQIRVGIVDLPSTDAPTSYKLGAQNFFVLTQYNRSYFYAMSVLELGSAVLASLQATGS